MSKRIPARLKAQLGEYLATWYRHYGKVAVRRAYHEDDEGSAGTGSAKPLFEGHPLLSEMPIGASSDLASIPADNQDTIDEATRRTDELVNELQNKLAFEHGKKLQQQLTNRIKLQPY